MLSAYNACCIYSNALQTTFIMAANRMNPDVGLSESMHAKFNSDLAPREDSDQIVHLPSLIRVFTVHTMSSLGPKHSSCTQRILTGGLSD